VGGVVGDLQLLELLDLALVLCRRDDRGDSHMVASVGVGMAVQEKARGRRNTRSTIETFKCNTYNICLKTDKTFDTCI